VYSVKQPRLVVVVTRLLAVVTRLVVVVMRARRIYGKDIIRRVEVVRASRLP
jgi:hypothetical protein